MLFALLFVTSVTFTIDLISTVAYYDQEGREYKEFKPINKTIESNNTSRQEDQRKMQLMPDKDKVIDNIANNKTINKRASGNAAQKVSKKPIKVIYDDWFMKHYDRIVQLEAISKKSVLDMYDHEPIFKQFPDLKMLARNLLWEQKQRTK